MYERWSNDQQQMFEACADHSAQPWTDRPTVIDHLATEDQRWQDSPRGHCADHQPSSASFKIIGDHQRSSVSFNIITVAMCSSSALSAMISTELLSKYSDQNDNAQTWTSSALSGKQQLGWNNARAIYFTNKPQLAHHTQYSRSIFHAWTPHNTIGNHQHVYEQIS